MEEEITYVAVAFKPNVASDGDSVKTYHEDAVIYDEVKTEEHTTCLLSQWPSVVSEKGKKAPVCTCLHLVAVGLGLLCIVVTSVVIVLGVHCQHLTKNILSADTALSERLRENQNLTAVNHQLWKDKSDMQQQIQQLSREVDGLNWTIGVIMEHENFPVRSRCPHKVCKPCEEGWVLFQSHCYSFGTGWKYWSSSQEECKKANANLVVIQSQQKQEFINNHTTSFYNGYGYWIGMREETPGKGLWVDGSPPTVQYWETQAGLRDSCVRILPEAPPLSNWNKVGCNSINRWICEKRALVKSE